MLFISPPFGNYFNLPYTKSIKGSYTLQPRAGLFTQIIKTLRYTDKGWVNKIGLRNPGIEYGIKHYNHKTDILSIAIMNVNEIYKINKMLPSDANIEINISCPNTEKNMIDEEIDVFLNNKREWCILKLSPLTSFKKVHKYYSMGFKQFHCCNTLPTYKNNKYVGGLSGPALNIYTTYFIYILKKKYKDITIIAGGGIYKYENLEYYKKLGADHFSISTIFFNPFNLAIFFANFYKNNQKSSFF